MVLLQEDRRAQLASQYMQRLATMRMHNQVELLVHLPLSKIDHELGLYNASRKDLEHAGSPPSRGKNVCIKMNKSEETASL